MARHLKISSVIVLSLMLYSYGMNSSTTKIPVSTQLKEAEDLYHQAFRLNSIFKGDEAKNKLLKCDLTEYISPLAFLPCISSK